MFKKGRQFNSKDKRKGKPAKRESSSSDSIDDSESSQNRNHVSPEWTEAKNEEPLVDNLSNSEHQNGGCQVNTDHSMNGANENSSILPAADNSTDYSLDDEF